MTNRVIAYLDKTVVRITGVTVHGLDPRQLEDSLTRTVGRPVRLIGVTGDALDMDVYGLGTEDILAQADGIVSAVSATEGIRATDVARIAATDAATELDIADIPRGPAEGCVRRAWHARDE